MKRATIGICAVALLALLVTCLSPVDAARPAQFGKQWVRSNPFQLFGWTVTMADYLYTDAATDAYKDLGMTSALLPYPYPAQVAAAESRRLPWQGQLWATEVNSDFIAWINSISGADDDNSWYIIDEPGYDVLPGVGQVANWLRTNRPNSLSYVNIYSGNDDAYIDTVMYQVSPDVLMHDNYPFTNYAGTDMNRFFSSTMRMRAKGLQYNVPVWAWMQCFTSMTENFVRMTSESEIRMQTFASLTAGFTGIGYFMFDTNDGAGYAGLVWWQFPYSTQYPSPPSNVVPDPLYAGVQAANVEVANLGKSLRYLTSTDVRFVPVHSFTPTGLTDWSYGAGGDNLIQSIGADGGSYAPYKDGMIGFFTDDLGEKYFMLTNLYHEAYSSAADTAMTFNVTFDGSVNQLLRLNRETGAQEVVPLSGNVLTVTLPGGTGDLFKYATGAPFATDEPTGPRANFWFAAAGDPTGTPITSINAPSGGTFDVSVWYQITGVWSHDALELLVGYDQTTSKGASAVPALGRISSSGSPASNIGGAWAYTLANNQGGGNGSGTRPYGAHVALATSLGTTTTASTPQRICDIKLTNNMPSGGSHTMSIWNDPGHALGWTTYVAKNSAGSVYGPAATLTVNSAAGGPISINDAKTREDGASVTCSGIVTASFGTFFYIESADRSSGIRVSGSGATVGNTATVTGTMDTLPSGERQIVSSSVDEVSGTALDPLAMTNKALGGGAFGSPPAGQVGVTGGTGLNNIGLLIETTGRVSGGSGNSFYIDDGSDVTVKATVSGGGIPSNGSYVTVTGISSCELVSGVTGRVILAIAYQ